jgi:hypothetical protein
MKKTEKIVVRKKKSKFDFKIAKDAIVDGQMQVNIGERVVIERERLGKRQISLCIFKGIEKNGDVTMWDETVSQFYCFNIGDPPIVKLQGDQEF